MQRAVKPTGEWCAPTVELAQPQLRQLLRTVRTTPDEDEAELEIIHDAGVEAAPAPIVRELSSEEEAAIAEAELVLLAPIGETGTHPVILDEPVCPPPVVPRAAYPAYPVHRSSGSIVGALVAVVLVLGAAVGGVLLAMNVVG